MNQGQSEEEAQEWLDYNIMGGINESSRISDYYVFGGVIAIYR